MTATHVNGQALNGDRQMANVTALQPLTVRWTKWRNELSACGLVYYFERNDGAVKIGCTHSYPSRRDALTRQHGRLRLVAWEIGSFDLEKRRHEQFAQTRVDPVAEWFRVNAELQAHIVSLHARCAETYDRSVGR